MGSVFLSMDVIQNLGMIRTDLTNNILENVGFQSYWRMHVLLINGLNLNKSVGTICISCVALLKKKNYSKIIEVRELRFGEQIIESIYDLVRITSHNLLNDKCLTYFYPKTFFLVCWKKPKKHVFGYK